jgi:hypothetical protein
VPDKSRLDLQDKRRAAPVSRSKETEQSVESSGGKETAEPAGGVAYTDRPHDDVVPLGLQAADRGQ